MKNLDLRLISSALFLPLLYWTGAVLAITLSGYPGVVCMTPVAWLLALPVGLRIQREADPDDNTMPRSAALAGALLGLYQGLLFGAGMAATPWVDQGFQGELPNPFLVSAVAAFIGAPVTALLALAVAWTARARQRKADV